MPELNWIPATDDETMTEYLEIAFGDDGNVYIRENINPDTVVVTTDAKWEAFVLGVQAGEFDHFVEGIEDGEGVEAAEDDGRRSEGGREPESV